MSNIISISGLDVFVGNKKVLDNINLQVKSGESVALIGGSGVGKSVLVKTIIGFLRYSVGQIEIEGKGVIYPVESNIKLHNIGVVFQHNALFDSLSVWENIAFGLLQKYKMKRKLAKQQAIEKLKLVGLDEEIANKFPNELSGGMQKRVAILRTVILQPKIIIFDEPTTGLDPITSDMIAKFIINIADNITKIVITHDMNVVKLIADHVAMIQNGKIAWYGAVNEVQHTHNEYIKKFFSIV